MLHISKKELSLKMTTVIFGETLETIDKKRSERPETGVIYYIYVDSSIFLALHNFIVLSYVIANVQFSSN
jgi:hypothetical protein